VCSKTNDNSLFGVGPALKRLDKGVRSISRTMSFVNFNDPIYCAKEAFPACADGFAKTLCAEFLNGGDGMVGGEKQDGFRACHLAAASASAIRPARVDMSRTDEATIFQMVAQRFVDAVQQAAVAGRIQRNRRLFGRAGKIVLAH